MSSPHHHSDQPDQPDQPPFDIEAERRHNLREFRVSRADYRLGRAFLVWPAVAAVVDAAFTATDPAGVLLLGEDPDAGMRYDSAASMVWRGVCDALLESVGSSGNALMLRVDEEPPNATLEHGALRQIVFESLEYDFAVIPERDEGRREMRDDFAAIVGREFGEVLVDPDDSDDFDPLGHLEVARIELLVDLIHRRVGTFPMGGPLQAD